MAVFTPLATGLAIRQDLCTLEDLSWSPTKLSAVFVFSDVTRCISPTATTIRTRSTLAVSRSLSIDEIEGRPFRNAMVYRMVGKAMNHQERKMSGKFTQAMHQLATEAKTEPSWRLYAEWCGARANRLHEGAVVIAEKLVGAVRHWNFEERKRFTLWIVTATGVAMEQCGRSQFKSRFGNSEPGMFEPRLVINEVVLPTLVEWRSAEPNNPEPHFWLGLYEEDGRSNLQIVMELDPLYSSALAALAVHDLGAVEYHQHELPSGYLGDAADDLVTLTKTGALIAGVANTGIRASLGLRCEMLQKGAEDWISLRKQLNGLHWEARVSLWDARPSQSLTQKS